MSSFLKRPGAQKGVTLIEVLAALVIISIGLLGIASLQANSLKLNQSSYMRSQATELAYEIVERMRANRDQARLGNYDLALTAAPPGGATVIAQDQAAWITEIVRVLPNGQGQIASAQVTAGPPPLRRIVVTIQWQDDRTVAGAATQQFQFTTEL